MGGNAFGGWKRPNSYNRLVKNENDPTELDAYV